MERVDEPLPVRDPLVTPICPLEAEVVWEPVPEGDPELALECATEMMQHVQRCTGIVVRVRAGERDDIAQRSLVRSLHAVAGLAGFLGLVSVAQLASGLERFVAAAGPDPRASWAMRADVLTAALDALRYSLDGLRATGGRACRAIRELPTLLDLVEEVATTGVPIEFAPPSSESVKTSATMLWDAKIVEFGDATTTLARETRAGFQRRCAKLSRRWGAGALLRELRRLNSSLERGGASSPAAVSASKERAR